MFKQSSSRSQRPKGFKVKHTLQICVLVAVCVWLLYQVKHSHDRKNALGENSIKISNGVGENIPETFRFGRKDLPQVHIDTSVEIEDHNEDDGNEGAEQEEPEVKLEDPEEEETKGVGEDEIDENDREGVEEEREHGEESEVEEGKDGQFKEMELLQNKDQENEEAGSHEAREEHYRGDDASSAVIRDTEKTESEGESLENGNVNEEQMENMENGNVNEEQMENMENGNVNEEQMENMENGLQIGNNATETEDATKVEESGVFSDSSVADLVNNSSTTDISLMDAEHESESTANSTSAEFSNEIKQQNNLADSTNATEPQNNSTYLANATEQQNDLTDLVNATKQQKNLTDSSNEIEQQNNLTDSANTNEQQNNSTDSTNETEQQNNSTMETSPIVSMEIQNSSSVPVDVENDNSYLQNSTLSMDGSLGENSTNVIETSVENINSNPAEDSNAEDGNSDSQKILIKQVENSNTTHETQEAEDASGISTEGDSVASEEEAAAHVDSNDPLAKADVVSEEAGVGARADLSTLPETEEKTENVAAE